MDEFTIRKYTPEDDGALFALIKHESSLWDYNEWDYWQSKNWGRYKLALAEGFAYLIFEGDTLCGYLRGRNDFGFGIWIHDLLIDKAYRGKGYGQILMEQVCLDCPNDTVYVMSDVDEYYSGKLGYERKGSIFVVKERE